MDVIKAIETRRSIRGYKDQEIEEAKLKQVIEAARLAPSANNRQGWKFVAVRDKGTRELIAKAASGQKFIAEAPVVIVACATICDHVMTCGQFAYPIDIAIAVTHIMLKAVEEGLGTCCIGAFDEKEVKQILEIPTKVRAVAVLPIGYPDHVPPPTARRGLGEILVFDKWS